ncbi:hypothetical protein QWY28_17395 [Nocardioides sp. SOB77]|uniref:Uncharacterized protein n=1 Tax=Nocardioides oceani TaxID=3058369 RepID=A0ABT8FJR4_9ACTN|nr:hypothetical protein [Nocardioides oceani]MDN4174740.1 hypothetical protein [Nocardioides oceani]
MTESTSPVGLRAAALAAAEAARAARVDVARAYLAQVLAPAPVEGLEVVAEADQLVVFTDGGDVCLAVSTVGPTAHLVTDDGGWTRRGEVTSLVQLGLLLEDKAAG